MFPRRLIGFSAGEEIAFPAASELFFRGMVVDGFRVSLSTDRATGRFFVQFLEAQHPLGGIFHEVV